MTTATMCRCVRQALGCTVSSWPTNITVCAVATSCCISDVPFQWEKGNFDSHSSHIFLPIFLKLKTKKHIWDTNQHAKFGKDRFTGGAILEKKENRHNSAAISDIFTKFGVLVAMDSP